MNSGAMIGLYSGILGGVIGLVGGVYGTYRSYRAANGSRERRAIILYAALILLFVAAYLTALFLIPLQYRWMLTMPYTLILVALLVGGIRKINAIRESEKSKA